MFRSSDSRFWIRLVRLFDFWSRFKPGSHLVPVFTDVKNLDRERGL